MALVAAVMAAGAEARPAVLYYLGQSFEGLAVEHVETRTRAPGFIYRTCDPMPHGCAPPLQVQNWALADRHPRRFSPAISCVRGLIRGVPAAVFSSTGGIEIYAGRTVIVLFGHPVARVMRATRAVRSTRSRRPSPRLAAPPAGVPQALRRCRRGDLRQALEASG